MQVLGPLNQRTQESFPIAGELYGWCSSVTAEDLAPGSTLKSVGFTPMVGAPDYCDPGGDRDSMLLRWENADGSGTAAAINYRIPIPKLRRLANAGPGAL